MRNDNAVVGGEISGHYFFRDFNYADSGDIAMLLMLRVLSEEKKLSQLVKPFHKYYSTEELNFHVRDTGAVIKIIEKTFKQKAKKIDYLDGIFFDFKDVWFIVRKSGTEDLLRLVIEGNDKKTVEKLQKELNELING